MKASKRKTRSDRGIEIKVHIVLS